MGMAGNGNGCGLFCSSDVEKLKPVAQWYEVGYTGVKLLRVGDNLVIEIGKESKRLEARLVLSDVDDLYRYLVETFRHELFGSEKPSMTALYTIRALLDAAINWLKIVSRERAALKRELEEVRARLAGYMKLKARYDELNRELDNIYETINEKCGDNSACRRELWRELKGNRLLEESRLLGAEMRKLEICDEKYSCKTPDRVAEELERELRDIELIEKRIALAALALSHAWRALTHPDVSDLEQIYDYSRHREEHGTLWDYFLKSEKEAKAEVVEQ